MGINFHICLWFDLRRSIFNQSLMHMLKNMLNLANTHNMKITDYEKCGRDTKYAKLNGQTKPDKQNITNKTYQTMPILLNKPTRNSFY